MTPSLPHILVVEDETELAELFAEWLSEEYDVEVAMDGETALELVDDDTDVVLLDRLMPGLSGDEVLEEVRDRGIDCRVSMVTAVEPDFDIIEMGFDTYLVKPVTRETLEETIEDLLSRNSYEEGVQQLFSLSSKKALLESEKSQSALADNEEYQELTEQINELRDDLDNTMDAFTDHEDYAGFYQEFDDADEEVSFE